MKSAALALLLAACGTPAVPPAADPPAPPTVAECTADTPLVPGVPGSPGHLVPTEVHPEGAAELVLLMRQMQADLGAARDAIQAGRPAPMAGLFDRHRRLRCAWPSDRKFRDPPFDAMAQAYLAAAEAAAREPDPRVAHANVLASCRACHEIICPGPVAAIKALQLR